MNEFSSLKLLIINLQTVLLIKTLIHTPDMVAKLSKFYLAKEPKTFHWMILRPILSRATPTRLRLCYTLPSCVYHRLSSRISIKLEVNE